MNRTLIVTLTALTLGTAALAEDAATTVTLPGTVTTSVKDAWAAFATAGGKAELLGADGSVIGTLNADGTVTLTGTATLSDVRSVTLTPATGEAITVNVTRDLSKPGAIKIEFTDARGRTQSLPLPAVVNRLKAAAPDDSGDTDESGDDRGAGDKGKGKDDKGGKPSTNPGKGKP
ncbi:hypothetical protein [Deinococcus soli (ex Cha et al. 2016)]|jgi:hypothetical protein|uniref:Uncharacterized protein n=2 Tax=Deinococcus soli (ex Cha et al. 2016) TaxID=1309411 RepID=A0ACC6KCU8_9DEIO|nr:hypothetical protein [Deinococcus soli (ex Cha et al. 2016)]MDR6217686.1 hypothetical protein [Deinococcus soli (ex Cha et al. 2016)]MDR6326995.1 hypothetical protein [Deinococcus soli (ex Cha et al. 2016)]MDR6750279.1 hypothetical protein [Deinococcus soli (ex Cha et al. 2016)]